MLYIHFGPINTSDNRFVPENVLLALEADLVKIREEYESKVIEPHDKTFRVLKVQHGRDWEDGTGYKNTKSTFSFPFNIISSSVTTGYNKNVVEGLSASLEITNLHNDVYGPDMEVPMQTTFTEYAVGGHQSRHVRLNTGSDDYTNRPEAWKIVFGECNAGTDRGAVGLVSADYPIEALGKDPTAATGTVSISSYSPRAGDYVIVDDGEESAKFEVPFENTKGLLFGPFDSQNVWLTVGGNYERLFR